MNLRLSVLLIFAGLILIAFTPIEKKEIKTIKDNSNISTLPMQFFHNQKTPCIHDCNY